MSNGPSDDERLDNDHTDELPILLETVGLDPANPHLSGPDLLGDTGEHTTRFPTFAAEEAGNVTALKADLASRAARIDALEADIRKLSGHWSDVERHLTAKDLRIDELSQTLATTRESLVRRETAEQHLATEIAARQREVDGLRHDLEQRRRESAARDSELAQLRSAAETAREEAATLREQLTERAATAADTAEIDRLREEVVTLSGYIANRRVWWDALEARAAAATIRIDELQADLAKLDKQRADAEALAARETARASALRTELVTHSRLLEDTRRALAASRAEPTEPRTAVASLEAQLQTARAAAATATAELRAVRKAQEHEGSAREAAAAHAASLASIETEVAAARHAPADAAADHPPAPAFDVIAQLEAEVEHKRQQVTAQLVELRDREQRLKEADLELARLHHDLGAARTELDQSRTDATRLERTLIDKDRALDARDARIVTLQEELSQRLGALQKLNAMDLSLQGLDSKMAERLRRIESSNEHAIAPALVCLTGDAPKQFMLTKGTTTIGRGSECDIQILTHFVSREHARITLGRGSVFIEDLSSTNGIFVNAVRVERHELRHGDVITVGETQFRFLESMAH